jgi:hypothetical protein
VKKVLVADDAVFKGFLPGTVQSGYKTARYKNIRIYNRGRQGPGRYALCYYLELSGYKKI